MIIVPESNSASWVVDLTSGTEIKVNVMDSAGEVAQTSPLMVGEGSDECLDQGLVL